MKKLDNCLCCSVKSGALIIAVLGLLFSVISLITDIHLLSYEHEYRESWEESKSRYGSLLRNQEINDDQYEVYVRWTDLRLSVFRGAVGFWTFCCLVSIICDGFVLFGIVHQKHKMFLPWLFYHGASIILGVAGVTVFSLYLMVKISSAMGFGIFVGFAIIFAIKVYFWMVVYSVHLNMKGVTQKQNGLLGNELY